MRKQNHKKSASKLSKLRIIGGEWRSRLVNFQAEPGLRPTPNRVRETLFNWLSHDCPASECLDMFAGSGALGFEAASRGAKHVTLIEYSTSAANSLTQIQKQLNAQDVTIMQADSLSVELTGKTFDIIFIDPPFNQGLAQAAINRVHQQQLLKPGGIIYLETEKQLDNLELPSSWHKRKDKVAGEVRYQLFDSEPG